MATGFAVKLLREAFFHTLIVASPILITAMLVGLIIGIFQTTTSIQEQTLSFVPKIIAILIAMIVFMSFIINDLVIFATRLFIDIAKVR